jgi:uncharacterized RDD family membrane protein YckC
VSAVQARSGQPADTTASGASAGVVTRGLALVLDAVLVVVVLVGGAWMAAVVVDLVRFRAPAAPELSATAWRIVAVSVFCAYNVVGWWLFGRTVGKALLGLRVETANGNSVPLWRSCLRILGYPLSALFLGLGFAMALVVPRRRALHDLLAGTQVVYYRI